MALLPALRAAALGIALALCVACPGTKPKEAAMAQAPVRIVLLHHSTGGEIWKGGVAPFFDAWNAEHGTRYVITEQDYPHTKGTHPRLGRLLPARVFNRLFRDHYPWENYPYDYWNLWVAHQGASRDRSEPNLDDLAKSFDVIVFKHCFPVSSIRADDGAPSVSSRTKTLANYKLQYEALKARMHQFPDRTFIVWTGPALTEASTRPEDAARAREFAAWVKDVWDEKGDNIYVWDFRELETDGGPFLVPGRSVGAGDSHPSPEFSKRVAPLLGRRIVDVIEGRGDGSSLTGR
ncbi:hypothetical protein [Mesoterricola silvestris]|uniref:SGNH/GDSL hydrolase family protein n=1 Tax=Mesoterricola silvestris TaxID=2927979 RepID=A0AA48GR13_9BACT|nr:hypothetical protein [Mesoterricola silvestris]BDU74125.1 hypothetical protein METEAL_32990 [Mesoterricola silvestris]